MQNPSGTRFLLNLHRCRGPITVEEGFNLGIIVRILQGVGMKVISASFVPYSDGTVNQHVDLGESHYSGGTYLSRRHAALELVICNETQDNRSKGREAADKIIAYFEPEETDVQILTWEAR